MFETNRYHYATDVETLSNATTTQPLPAENPKLCASLDRFISWLKIAQSIDHDDVEIFEKSREAKEGEHIAVLNDNDRAMTMEALNKIAELIAEAEQAKEEKDRQKQKSKA
jgi:hypothetical protein